MLLLQQALHTQLRDVSGKQGLAAAAQSQVTAAQTELLQLEDKLQRLETELKRASDSAEVRVYGCNFLFAGVCACAALVWCAACHQLLNARLRRFVALIVFTILCFII